MTLCWCWWWWLWLWCGIVGCWEETEPSISWVEDGWWGLSCPSPVCTWHSHSPTTPHTSTTPDSSMLAGASIYHYIISSLSLSLSLLQIDHKRLKQSIMMNIPYRNTPPYILFCGAVQRCSPSQSWVLSPLFHQFYDSGAGESVGVLTLQHYIFLIISASVHQHGSACQSFLLGWRRRRSQKLWKCCNILSLLDLQIISDVADCPALQLQW